MISADNIESKDWVVICHLSGLVGMFFPLGNIILPIVIWLIKGDEYSDLHNEGKKVINFHISWTIYMIFSGLLVLVVIGLPLVIGFLIFGMVASIKGVMAANEGKYYQYPLSIPFLK